MQQMILILAKKRYGMRKIIADAEYDSDEYDAENDALADYFDEIE